MRKLVTLAALPFATLMLAACGSADDASTEATADTVEMPADRALEPITEAPVADPSATATDAPAGVDPTTAEQAGEAGADVAEEVLKAAGESEADSGAE